MRRQRSNLIWITLLWWGKRFDMMIIVKVSDQSLMIQIRFIFTISAKQQVQYNSHTTSLSTATLNCPHLSSGQFAFFSSGAILIFQFYYQMNNKSQSTALPPPKHFKICLERRRPFLRTSPCPPSSHLQQITQNHLPVPSLPSTPSSDVFLIVSSETSKKELVFPVRCLLTGELGRSGVEGSLKDLERMLEMQALGEEEVAQLEHSLIEELLTLQNQSTAPLCIPTKKIRLQQLNIIEAQSFQEESSSLFDAQSEAVALTEEEQHFFNNFILDELEQPQDEAQTKRLAELPEGSPSHPTCLLQQRKKVIRNFFRPKASFFKDDKTRCNSSTNLQEISDSSNRMSFSPNRNDTHKHSGLDRSSKFLAPFLE